MTKNNLDKSAAGLKIASVTEQQQPEMVVAGMGAGSSHSIPTIVVTSGIPSYGDTWDHLNSIFGSELFPPAEDRGSADNPGGNDGGNNDGDNGDNNGGVVPSAGSASRSASY